MSYLCLIVTQVVAKKYLSLKNKRIFTVLLLKVMKESAKLGWHLSNMFALIRLQLNIFANNALQKGLDSPFEDHDKATKKDLQRNFFLISTNPHH